MVQNTLKTQPGPNDQHIRDAVTSCRQLGTKLRKNLNSPCGAVHPKKPSKKHLQNRMPLIPHVPLHDPSVHILAVRTIAGPQILPHRHICLVNRNRRHTNSILLFRISANPQPISILKSPTLNKLCSPPSPSAQPPPKTTPNGSPSGTATTSSTAATTKPPSPKKPLKLPGPASSTPTNPCTASWQNSTAS